MELIPPVLIPDLVFEEWSSSVGEPIEVLDVDLPTTPQHPDDIDFVANPNPNVARKLFLDSDEVPNSPPRTPTSRDTSPKPRKKLGRTQVLRQPTGWIRIPGCPSGPAQIVEGGNILLEWEQPEFAWRKYAKQFPAENPLVEWRQAGMRANAKEPMEFRLRLKTNLWTDGQVHNARVTVGNKTVHVGFPAIK